MIRIELEVTPEQLIVIGQILKAEPVQAEPVQAEPVQEQPQPKPPRATTAKPSHATSDEIAGTLKKWRKYRRLTQSEAAARFGVSQYIWHMFEHSHKHRQLGQASRAMMVMVHDKVRAQHAEVTP